MVGFRIQSGHGYKVVGPSVSTRLRTKDVLLIMELLTVAICFICLCSSLPSSLYVNQVYANRKNEFVYYLNILSVTTVHCIPLVFWILYLTQCGVRISDTDCWLSKFLHGRIIADGNPWWVSAEKFQVINMNRFFKCIWGSVLLSVSIISNQNNYALPNTHSYQRHTRLCH